MAGSYQVLQEHINALGATMEKGFTEIKGLLSTYEARVRALEQAEAGCQPIITSRLDGAYLRIADHDGLFRTMREEIAVMRKQVEGLEASNRILKWFAGVVGSAVVLWLVASLLEMV